MKLLTSILMFASVASLGVANAKEKKPMTTAAINSTYSNVNKSEMKILNPGSLPSTQGPSEYFTGKVVDWMEKVSEEQYQTGLGAE